MEHKPLNGVAFSWGSYATRKFSMWWQFSLTKGVWLDISIYKVKTLSWLIVTYEIWAKKAVVFCHFQYFLPVEGGIYFEFESILSLNLDVGKEQVTDCKALMINKWYFWCERVPVNLYKQVDSTDDMDQLWLY
jgi:hypothetical protein